MIKRKNIRQKNITSKDNQQDQDVGLDHEWLEENFRTREPDFYRKLYQTKFRGDDTKTYQISGGLIGNSKITRKV